MTNSVEWPPSWASQAVWYQIFPDRFCNSSPARGAPTLADMEGAWPHDMTSPWQIHPWTSDWYELQPYERANGHSIWWNLIRRRYGGDLQGIIAKLDYLQDLGITALYLNPVFQSPSHHKYDGTLYHHIDYTLGPDPAGDRALLAQEDPGDPGTWAWTAADRLALQLIQEVHRRGMRIIFDGVFNHVSSASPFFRDVVERQRASPYRDWFSITSWDDPAQDTRFSYNGWWGIAELPEWRQDDQGPVHGPREYIFDCTRRWMAPFGDAADGIDGWRLDVAACIRHPFWQAWRCLVKGINPAAYLTAEVIGPLDLLQPFLQGDEFDAVMNYNFGFACADYFINRRARITTSYFDTLLRDLREAFDPCVAYVQQNLLDSHDANRVTSHIVNPDGMPYRRWREYHLASKVEHNPGYDPRKPSPAEYDIQKLIALFQMTYVGAPMIYYGDEVGMWGGNDPCCRKPMVWDELVYAPEATLPDGTRRALPDTVEVNRDLLATYRRLIHLRHRFPALSLGDFRTLRTDDAAQLYVYSRSYEGQTLIVALNNRRHSQPVAFEAPSAGRLTDVLNGGSYAAPTGGPVTLELPALWGAVLEVTADA